MINYKNHTIPIPVSFSATENVAENVHESWQADPLQSNSPRKARPDDDPWLAFCVGKYQHAQHAQHVAQGRTELIFGGASVGGDCSRAKGKSQKVEANKNDCEQSGSTAPLKSS